jgi:hypothetical protein
MDSSSFGVALSLMAPMCPAMSDETARTKPARLYRRGMRQLLAALVLAWVGALAHAQDALETPECLAARAELERSIADSPPSRGTPGERLLQARGKAARACLDRSSGTAQRAGAPDPPIRVPAPTMAARPPSPGPGLAGVAASVPSPPAGPPGPVVIPRPATVTACDPAGCWDTEGRRLNQMGPVLMGPHGLCSLQAGTVQCP